MKESMSHDTGLQFSYNTLKWLRLEHGMLCFTINRQTKSNLKLKNIYAMA